MPYRDPYEPPLAPRVYTNRPPYWPSYKEYHGRPDWWYELSHKDELLRMGRQTGIWNKTKEKERQWYDPKVPDGTSLAGPFGLDSTYYKNTTIKADQPGNFFEFQKKVREGSLQYKNIAEKWNISEQHPGIVVNPTANTLARHENNVLGRRLLSNNFLSPVHWGPRFWDKPINEGCIEKGLALTKLAACASFFYSFLESIGYRGRNVHHHVGVVKFNEIFKNWYSKYLPVPAVLTFTFGVSACTAATIRHVDDSWNWTIASIVTGMAQTSMHSNNAMHGLLVAGPLIVLGLLFQLVRTYDSGLQNMVTEQMFSGRLVPYTSPLSWKYVPGGDGAPAKAFIDQYNRMM